MVRKEHGVGGKGFPENFDDEVEVSEVLSHLRHESLHQVIVGLLLGHRRLLVH